MKILIPAIAIAFSVVACNSNTKTDSEVKKEIVADTTTNYNNSVLTDTGTALQPEVAPVTPVPTLVKKNKNTAKGQKPATTSPVTNPAPADKTASTSDNTIVTQPGENDNTAPVAEEKKKGWSNAAKGAVIGGGAGAVGGAIISKKKGKGAVIGGVLGAAGGYIIGRKKDKNDTTR